MLLHMVSKMLFLTVVTAPFDAVKILLLVQNENSVITSGLVEPYSGAIYCFFRVWTEEGTHHFWRGMWPHLIRNFPVQLLNKLRSKNLYTLRPAQVVDLGGIAVG